MYLDVEKILDILSKESVKEICKFSKCNSKQEISNKIKKQKNETLKYSDVLNIDIENIDRTSNIDLWLNYICMIFILTDGVYKVKFNKREENIFNELSIKIDNLKYKICVREIDVINEITEVCRNFLCLTDVMASGKNSDYVKEYYDVSSLVVLQKEIISVFPDFLENDLKKKRNNGILKVLGISAATILSGGIGFTLLGLGATKLVIDKTTSKMEKQQKYNERVVQGITNLMDFGFLFSLLVSYIILEQEKF